jgi:hypothetical protein
MPAPEIIHNLIKRFEEQHESYRSDSYNETQLRREFLDPFFEALGWDVHNRKGWAEAYKDVIHEDAIRVGGATKAPDYAFRIGGTRKFFVEAKKPAINVREDVHPAYQLRRYAWSAKLPLSILTDFEELAIYDCRQKPDKSDKASTGRINIFPFREYADKWEEISTVFSRDAVLKGSFDRFAESIRGKRGTAEVDDAFLHEIESWREKLARNIALRNQPLTTRELNYAVQMIIDRIIFLRICEDRGIEPIGSLQALLNGGDTYARLVALFRRADERYNSGLFHFREEKGQGGHPDTLTPTLNIDDRVFKEIISGLYYPDCPYEFSVLPADILGQVYEQFLGKVIRLTAGHQAKVEEKPEVRKAGGVYYTPTYVVDYIVRQTLGQLLKGKKPGEMGVGRGQPVRVLDPACGSGSFLIGAYQHLLDWYRDGYAAAGAEKAAAGKDPKLYQSAGGEWKLTTGERKRILLEHIYGVDIDPQAVEVTKLSLLLKVLEGENEQTLGRQMRLWQGRALPDLGGNIKCGNSLIGPDYYANRQLSLLDEEEHYRVNAFDWQTQFDAALKGAGGFDAVIGNPPYVRQEMLGEQKTYFQKHYRVYHGMADLYTYFIEKGVALLKPGGLFSYIVANKWMRANYGEPLRSWLKGQEIEEILDFGDLPVFAGATTYPCIIRIRKGAKPGMQFDAVKMDTLIFTSLEEHASQRRYPISQDRLGTGGWSLVDEHSARLLEKLREIGVPLEEYTKNKVFRGILTGLNEAFVIDAASRERLIAEDPRSAELIVPFLAGRDIKRYAPAASDKFLIFTRHGIDINAYPAIKNHLSNYRTRLTPKPKGWKGDKWPGRKPGNYQWYEIQDTIDYHAEFEKPKIIYPNICKKPEFTFDPNKLYTNQKCFIIPTEDYYLLGYLNSSLCHFLFEMILPKLRGNFFEPSYVFFKDFPIYKIDFSNPSDISIHEKIVALVNRMLELNRAKARTPQERESLRREFEASDRQIDRLVYRLYELSGEEIAIVEGGMHLTGSIVQPAEMSKTL